MRIWMDPQNFLGSEKTLNYFLFPCWQFHNIVRIVAPRKDNDVLLITSLRASFYSKNTFLCDCCFIRWQNQLLLIKQKTQSKRNLPPCSCFLLNDKKIFCDDETLCFIYIWNRECHYFWYVLGDGQKNKIKEDISCPSLSLEYLILESLQVSQCAFALLLNDSSSYDRDKMSLKCAHYGFLFHFLYGRM